MKLNYKQMINVCMTDGSIKPSSDINPLKEIKYFTFRGLYVWHETKWFYILDMFDRQVFKYV